MISSLPLSWDASLEDKVFEQLVRDKPHVDERCFQELMRGVEGLKGVHRRRALWALLRQKFSVDEIGFQNLYQDAVEKRIMEPLDRILEHIEVWRSTSNVVVVCRLFSLKRP